MNSALKDARPRSRVLQLACFARHVCFLPLLLPFAFSPLSTRAAQSSSLLSKRFPLDEPFPSLVAAAKTNHIPLEPIAPPGAATRLKPGDFVSTLFTLHDAPSRPLQWLVALQVVAASAGDKAELKPRKPLVLYSSFGHRLEYTSAPVMVALRMLGPFTDALNGKRPAKVREKRARFALDEGFLSIGLDRAAAAMLRLRQSKTQTGFAFGPDPIGKSDNSPQPRSSAAFVPTTEEERALGGAIPALVSYFDILQETPGLSEIAFKIVDLPSLWSMLRHGGIHAHFGFEVQSVTRADDALGAVRCATPVYLFPLNLTLNEHRALNLNLYVTQPRPPLLTCGGALALLAENPYDKGNYLTVRVLSALPGPNHESFEAKKAKPMP